MIEAICFDLGYKTAIIALGRVSVSETSSKIVNWNDYFDTIISSEEAGIEKPAREIFQLALSKLKGGDEDTRMVGNRVDADIGGANRMGMKSIWFKWNDRYRDSIDTEEKRSNFTISYMPELLGILDLIIKRR